MKRILAAAAAFLIILSTAACGDSDSSSKASSASSSQQSSSQAADEKETTGKSTALSANAKEYRIGSFGKIDGKYTIDLVNGDNYDDVYSIEIDDEGLANAIGKFSKYFTIKLDVSSGKLDAYELIDKNGISLGQLNEDEIRDKFDPTRQYEIVDWSYTDSSALSELEEGKLYKAPITAESPKFYNDTDKDLVVYVFDDFSYEEHAYAYPLRGIDGLGRADQSIFVMGDNAYIRVEKLTPDMLKPDGSEPQAVFVNGLESGQYAELMSACVLVNAGDSDVNVNIVTYDGGSYTETIGAGTMYAIDYQTIDHIEVI